jgi:hypothetical protein
MNRNAVLQKIFEPERRSGAFRLNSTTEAFTLLLGDVHKLRNAHVEDLGFATNHLKYCEFVRFCVQAIRNLKLIWFESPIFLEFYK